MVVGPLRACDSAFEGGKGVCAKNVHGTELGVDGGVVDVVD